MHLHKWTRWETVGSGDILDNDLDKCGVFETQRRECTRCGKAQMNNSRALA